MATVTKTFTFDTSLENWAGTSGSGAITTFTRNTTDGSPGTGCLSARLSGKNQNPSLSYWKWIGTLESLGVPTGATVTKIGVSPNNDYNWRCSEYNTGTGINAVGPFELYDNTPSLLGTFSAAQGSVTGTTSWATVNGAEIGSLNLASSATIQLWVSLALRTGNSNTAAVTLLVDQVVIEIEYSLAVSQISGTANGASTDSGILKGKGKLYGASSVAITTSGILKAKGELAGTSNGVATVTGTAHADALIQGTSDGVATTQGILKGKGELVGTSDNLATTSGILSATVPIQGVSDGLATIEGTLRALGSGVLQGTSDGLSTISGSLKGKGNLIGTSDSISSSEAILQGKAKIFAFLFCSATVEGILGGKGKLSGISYGTSSASAAPTYEGRITGIAEGLAIVTGYLKQVESKYAVKKMKSPAPNLNQQAKVDFRKSDFEAAIWNKGYDVIIEKALKCPCKSEGGGTNTSCQNCGGTGWFFINPFSTRALIHSINLSTEYRAWTEENLGTVSVTVRDIDSISYMDRITLLDTESSYSETLHPRIYNGNLFAFTTYGVVKRILNIYRYIADNALLEKVPETNYQLVDENKIIFDNSYLGVPHLTFTVRYIHALQFHVLDLPREVMVTNITNIISGKEEITQMPIHAIARRAHYVLDRQNFDKNYIFDNSTVL